MYSAAIFLTLASATIALGELSEPPIVISLEPTEDRSEDYSAQLIEKFNALLTTNEKLKTEFAKYESGPKENSGGKYMGPRARPLLLRRSEDVDYGDEIGRREYQQTLVIHYSFAEGYRKGMAENEGIFAVFHLKGLRISDHLGGDEYKLKSHTVNATFAGFQKTLSADRDEEDDEEGLDVESAVLLATVDRHSVEGWKVVQRLSRARYKGDPDVTKQVIEKFKKVLAGELKFRKPQGGGVYGDGGSAGIIFELEEGKAMEIFLPFWEKDRFRGRRTGLLDVHFVLGDSARVPFDSESDEGDYFVNLKNPGRESESPRVNAELAKIFKEVIMSDKVDAENDYIKEWRTLLGSLEK